MTTYRVGTHHGVTICAEDDGVVCGREGHDCQRGHLVAVITNGDTALAERICALLNGPPYPGRCTLEPGVRGCVCQPWPDCHVGAQAPDADHTRGAAEALSRLSAAIESHSDETGHKMLPVSLLRNMLDGVASELGIDGPAAPTRRDQEIVDVRRRIAEGAEHRPSSLGGDGYGYGPCVGCGELWPCKQPRRECP